MSALDAISRVGKRPVSQAHASTHVVILLATHNGAKHLTQQLTSIAGQTHENWSLIASDDGSEDGTTDILKAFARGMSDHRVTLLRGPQKGSAQNFLSLLRAAGGADFVAFCDQDDFWLPTKLEKAAGVLKGIEHPTIYGSRTFVTDAELRPQNPSLLFLRKPGFGNALVQNIAGGNTMVINRAALDILQPASLAATGVIAHDWWCYQMVSGCDGAVVVDPEPTVLYRQHDANLIGANDSIRARLTRLKRVASGEFSDWMDENLTALNGARHWLTEDNARRLDALIATRQASLPRRIVGTWQAGLYRQTLRGTFALWLAVVMGKL